MSVQAPTSEDCLYLNIWTPGLEGERPVLVWLHGGAFLEGAASQAWYDGSVLARRGDIVVVTPNYRLGAFGWLYLGGLSGASDTVANPGMLDQVRALEWVAENIGAFGGDPENVTVAGQSAGSRSVAALLASPRADGLFAKAIAMSRAGITHDVDEAAALTRYLLRDVLAVDGDDAAALKRMPVEDLVAAGVKLFSRLDGGPEEPAGVPTQLAHVVDDATLPRSPLDAMRAGDVHQVPTMIGCTVDETKMAIAADPSLAALDEAGYVSRLAQSIGPDAARGVFYAYRQAREERGASTSARDIFVAIDSDRGYRRPITKLAEEHSRLDAPTYMYLFAWPSPNPALGACHTIDLSFVFGTFDIEGIPEFSGSGSRAEELSRTVQDAWFAFMRSGDPTTRSLPWPQFDATRRMTMAFDEEPTVVHAPLNRELAIWDDIVW
jgi:para-nitrobenzyl esterase